VWSNSTKFGRPGTGGPGSRDLRILDLEIGLTEKKTNGPGRDKGMRKWALNYDIFCNMRWQQKGG